MAVGSTSLLAEATCFNFGFLWLEDLGPGSDFETLIVGLGRCNVGLGG